MDRLISQIKGYLIPLLVVIFVFFSFKNYFEPKYQDIVAWRQKIPDQKEEAADLFNYLTYLKKLAANPGNIEENVVNYALPKDKDVATLIITYEGLSKLEKVTVDPLTIQAGVISEDQEGMGSVTKTASPEEEKNRFEPQVIDFKMTAKSTELDALKKLMDEILATRRVLEIKDVTLNFDDKDNKKIDFSLIAYYFPNPNPQKSSSRLATINYDDLVSKLSEAKVYEQAVLTDVETGKEDLFSEENVVYASRSAILR